jgi:hypothetical protein
MKTFDDLWNEAENLIANDAESSSVGELYTEAEIKFALLIKCLNIFHREDYNGDGAKLLKSKPFGQFLLALAKISYIESVNIFAALQEAIENEKLEITLEKYK